MRKIIIKFEKYSFEAELNESEISKKIMEKLPVTSTVRRWGEEIYFDIPVDEEIKNPVKEVNKGDIGYWPEGKCFCIFFGPTPVSKGDKIIPASEVEIIGKIYGDLGILKEIKEGERVTIEKV
ncbi:MAG TPA: hypothetical protein ENF61_01575 [Firmicutes bacterium]|nr:hypothetical protein [Bacillota bacterium]